jgi:hypothetical protein
VDTLVGEEVDQSMVAVKIYCLIQEKEDLVAAAVTPGKTALILNTDLKEVFVLMKPEAEVPDHSETADTRINHLLRIQERVVVPLPPEPMVVVYWNMYKYYSSFLLNF